MLFNSKLEVGQGARRLCPVCNSPIRIRRTGRTRIFCSATCRDVARRNANFADFGVTRPTASPVPRNPKKASTKSVLCNGDSADRRPTIIAVGLGCHVGPQSPESSTERAAVIRNAIRTELAARWSRGGIG
jgi:hypothetical protein